MVCLIWIRVVLSYTVIQIVLFKTLLRISSLVLIFLTTGQGCLEWVMDVPSRTARVRSPCCILGAGFGFCGSCWCFVITNRISALLPWLYHSWVFSHRTSRWLSEPFLLHLHMGEGECKLRCSRGLCWVLGIGSWTLLTLDFIGNSALPGIFSQFWSWTPSSITGLS